jgi:hypothetical protein
MFSFIHCNIYKGATIALFSDGFHSFIPLIPVSKICIYANKLFFKFASVG